MVRKINRLEEKLLDAEVDKAALERIQQRKHKTYSEEEVLGPHGLDEVELDEDDGWE